MGTCRRNSERIKIGSSDVGKHMEVISTERRRWRRRYKDGDGDNSNDGDDSIKSINTQLSEREREREREREKRQAHEYETPGVVFYLLSVQPISQNESIISII